MTRSILIALLLAVGCSAKPSRAESSRFWCTPVVPWTCAPGYPERAQRAVELATRLWGGTAARLDLFSVVVLPGGLMDCGDGVVDCGGMTTWGLIKLAAFRSPCLEATALLHEVGHAVLLRNDHDDPRWHDRAFWIAGLKAMDAIVPTGDRACHELLQREIASLSNGLWIGILTRCPRDDNDGGKEAPIARVEVDLTATNEETVQFKAAPFKFTARCFGLWRSPTEYIPLLYGELDHVHKVSARSAPSFEPHSIIVNRGQIPALLLMRALQEY